LESILERLIMKTTKNGTCDPNIYFQIQYIALDC